MIQQCSVCRGKDDRWQQYGWWLVCNSVCAQLSGMVQPRSPEHSRHRHEMTHSVLNNTSTHQQLPKHRVKAKRYGIIVKEYQLPIESLDYEFPRHNIQLLTGWFPSRLRIIDAEFLGSCFAYQ